MKIRDKVAQVIESGVEPITLQHEIVRFFDDSPRIYRTFLQINSLELGTLTYRQYRFVARRNKQGDQLVNAHITKLFRAIPQILSEQKVRCFTIPVYAKLLRDGVLAKMLFEGFALFPKVPASMICVELSADILYEDVEAASAQIKELRELGVKVAIGEVGDEFCPVFRLSALPFEYAFLDAYATDRLLDENAEHTVGGLVDYLHALRVCVVAPALEGDTHTERARTLGCDGYTAAREEVTDGEG